MAADPTWATTSPGRKRTTACSSLTFDEDDNGAVPTRSRRSSPAQRVSTGELLPRTHRPLQRPAHRGTTPSDWRPLAQRCHRRTDPGRLERRGDGNLSPTAAFTSSCTNLGLLVRRVRVRAIPKGPPGRPTPGASATARPPRLAKPDHTYHDREGTYPVTPDGRATTGGATGTVTHPGQRSHRQPGTPPFASDGFARTVTNGWGKSRSLGGPWTSMTGSAPGVLGPRPAPATIRHAVAGSQGEQTILTGASAPTPTC